MPKETSAGAVIFRKEDNQILYLLLHYEAGHWDLPKGHIEENETEIETAKREVEEETGIKDIEIIDGFKEWIKYSFRDTYNLEQGSKEEAPFIFKIVTFYLAETKTKEIKISFEHTGYRWLVYEEAMKQLTFKKAREILEKANNFLLRGVEV
ncbi:MAG: NUDIX domain-containing protein [Patescibacteria group bacterium]|nr:NUDIX domain-containing protein [Patescibacteria group bacterium]